MRSALLTVLFTVLACGKPQSGPSDAPPGGRACTEIGCVDGLRVTLDKATPWATGTYEFAFEVDGAAVRCTGALPLKACDAGPSLTCEPAGAVQIGESGCALPPETHGFSDVQFKAGAPRSVKLAISRDGQPVHNAELAPTYTVSRPNGPDCEPVCNSASETVQVP